MSTRHLTLARKCRPGPGWVLEGDTKVRVSAAARQTTLHQLADHANDDGVCRLSMYTLASEMGWSYRTVRRALESLEKDGFIEREHRYGKRGYRVADEIRLVSMVASPCVHSGQALEAPLRSEKMGHAGACRTQEENHMPFGIDPEFCPPPETPPKTPAAFRDDEKMKVREERAMKKPDSPAALAFDFWRKAKKVQPHIANPANVMAVAGAVKKLMDEHGATAREIRLAMRLLRQDVRGKQLPHPLGQLFIKQQDRWLQAARDEIYEKEELPRLQKENLALWHQIERDVEIWLTDNPEASYDQQLAYAGALYKNYA